MENNKRPESMERITNENLAKAFIDEQVALVKKQVGSKKVLLALSGGVDSSVVAALLSSLSCLDNKSQTKGRFLITFALETFKRKGVF